MVVVVVFFLVIVVVDAGWPLIGSGVADVVVLVDGTVVVDE